MDELSITISVAIDETYFKAADIDLSANEVPYDVEKKLVYLISRANNGKMVIYNYANYTVEATGISIEHTSDFSVAFGQNKHEKELLIGGTKFVNIYNASTLEFKDRFRVFGDDNSQFIYSIDYREPNLIFIGAGNASDSDNGQGALVFDRNSGQLINRAKYGDHFLRMKTFLKNQSTGQIGLYGIGGFTSKPRLISDVYSSNGEIETNNFEESLPNETRTSLYVFQATEQTDYFITGLSGNLFYKDDTSFIGSLNKNSLNFCLNDDGSLIYAIDLLSVNVYEYPSMKMLSTIPLSEKVIGSSNILITGFVDKDKLILIYESSNQIYISKLDLQ